MGVHVRAILWRHEGDSVVCEVCPNSCHISDGGVGICGVRRHEAGVLYALTYGKVSSIAVDPIEKKPVYHYRPGTSVLSAGSLGCSMRCGHCQNWRISRASPEMAGCELHYIDPETLAGLAQASLCSGVAFTYNEPVIWIEYVRDAAEACRAAGLFTVMVTNGYITTAGLDVLGGLIDVWRVDIKGFRPETYRRLCGVSDLRSITRAAERALHQYGMHVEVVTNLVPGINDSPEELGDIARWIAGSLGPGTPWHLTRFVPCLDYAGLEPTPLESLIQGRQIGRSAGLHHVYLGNVDWAEGQNTVCPKCGALVIRRSGYTVVETALAKGACAECDEGLGIAE